MEHIDQVYLGIFFIFAIFTLKMAHEGKAEIAKAKGRLKAHREANASFLQKIDEQEQTLQALLQKKETLKGEFNNVRTNEKGLRKKVKFCRQSLFEIMPAIRTQGRVWAKF